MRAFLLIFLLFPTLVTAQEIFTPPRGSEMRRNLMDAMRPHAAWQLGAPIEFVVEDLRVAGDVAYASLSPQRPGGGVIDPALTPMMQRGELDPEAMDGIYIHALYQKSGAVWVALHWSIGATDVWWASPDFCVLFKPVTPEVCY